MVEHSNCPLLSIQAAIIFKFFDGWIDNSGYFELFNYSVVIPICQSTNVSFSTSIISLAALKYAKIVHVLSPI